MSSKNINLYDLFKVGYTNDKKLQNAFAEKHNFKLDKDLSNDRHQIYYNEQERKLIHNINGTQNTLKNGVIDWVNNAKIAVGLARKTERYDEEKEVAKRAKEKYQPIEHIFSGHSQAGKHASLLTNGFLESKGYTYNKANPINSIKSDREYEIRHVLDPVSLGNALKADKTLYAKPLQGLFKSHNLENLKDENILI